MLSYAFSNVCRSPISQLVHLKNQGDEQIFIFWQNSKNVQFWLQDFQFCKQFLQETANECIFGVNCKNSINSMVSFIKLFQNRASTDVEEGIRKFFSYFLIAIQSIPKKPLSPNFHLQNVQAQIEQKVQNSDSLTNCSQNDKMFECLIIELTKRNISQIAT